MVARIKGETGAEVNGMLIANLLKPFSKCAEFICNYDEILPLRTACLRFARADHHHRCISP